MHAHLFSQFSHFLQSYHPQLLDWLAEMLYGQPTSMQTA